MPTDPGITPPGLSITDSDVDVHGIRALALKVAAHLTLSAAAEFLSVNLAQVFKAPLALLSRDALSWRFEAHAFPDAPSGEALSRIPPTSGLENPVEQVQDDSGHAWTAIALGTHGDRDWALLVRGPSSTWINRAGFEYLVENVCWSLSQVANNDRAAYASRFQRRLHKFARRLASELDSARLNALVLQSIASQVGARTAALAIPTCADDTLAIVATLGYPISIVEHLRIRPGEGVIGRVYESRKPLVGDATHEHSRRLRYRTTSYMVLPVIASRKPLAVIALTDTDDGQPFDSRDLAAARVMATYAATGYTRQQLGRQLIELTELATVDSVTGLFNRRYFETRLEAEVERARRQQQDLALLLIDIDDFKRVNDMRGHLEGDRILREVADLLRAGVRIFDICARYGGEEFVIVMPGASIPVAQQVAERIRSRIERSFCHDLPSVTASVGVGMLTDRTTADELVDVADRALIAAKKAGKNMVWTGTANARRSGS
jgi:diguanylate cyclase (GGDEF)-like protein